MVAASNYFENKVLNLALVDTQSYIALWTADPGDDVAQPTNSNAKEVSGGGYVRRPAQFTVQNGTATLNADVTWTNMPATSVGAIVIYDAPTGGNAIFHGPLVATKTVGAGDAFTLPAANVTITAD